MFKLEKPKTVSTPQVIIDEENGYMMFSGESFPENVSKFYDEITDWLQTYLEGDFSEFVFDCALAYFNSSTSKLLMNIFELMDNAVTSSNSITVNWMCSPDNDIIIECGEEFAEDFTNIKFVIQKSLA